LIATTGNRHASLVKHLTDWNFKWEYAKNKENAFVMLRNAVDDGKPYDVALIDHQSLGNNIDTFAQQIFTNPLSKQTKLKSSKIYDFRGFFIFTLPKIFNYFH